VTRPANRCRPRSSRPTRCDARRAREPGARVDIPPQAWNLPVTSNGRGVWCVRRSAGRSTQEEEGFGPNLPFILNSNRDESTRFPNLDPSGIGESRPWRRRRKPPVRAPEPMAPVLLTSFALPAASLGHCGPIARTCRLRELRQSG
jgi:hypothetical protein